MFARVQRLPITIKVPLVVVAITVGASLLISERVLTRLTALQEQHLHGLTTAYLDGLSSAVLPAVLREDVWEAFDTLDRSRALYASLKPVETMVTGADGRVLAASDPQKAPVLSPPSKEFEDRFRTADLVIDAEQSQAFARRELLYQNRSIGTIYATLDVQHLFAERRSVLATLILTNGLLALAFAAIGYFAVRRMVHPVRVLTDHLRAGLGGPVTPIPPEEFPRHSSEFRRLFANFNALVDVERERSALAVRLADEERLASLGRLASGMAHEINNPLGGLFNALDTLKKHGDIASVRERSVSLIERGLAGIRDVVQAALATYRSDRSPRRFSSVDFDDLRLLLGPELRRRHQTLHWAVEFDDAGAPELPGAPVRQALLNLLLNASAAAGEGGDVAIAARVHDRDGLEIEISDSGTGMPEEAARVLTGQGTWSRLQNGKGLGLWMVNRLAQDLHGTIMVDQSQFGGALVRLRFPSARSTWEEQRDVA
jgi:two-component system, OmpR family, sensor kinase